MPAGRAMAATSRWKEEKDLKKEHLYIRGSDRIINEWFQICVFFTKDNENAENF